jgi:hypothetical protein
MSHQSNEIEYKGYCIVKDAIKDKLCIKKLVEGTKADIAVKPIDIIEDQWLPIQLKVTSRKRNNAFHFGLKNNDYTGMILLLVSLETNCFWIVNGSDVVGQNMIHIGARSQHKMYDIHDLATSLLSIYNTECTKNLDIINIPTSKYQIREQEYRRKREQNLHFLKFEYPDLEGQAFDFMVNGFKVQEKVMSSRKKNGKIVPNRYRVWVTRCGKPYVIGDNAYYWFHIENTDIFYVIPEAEMIRKNIVVQDLNIKNQQNIIIDTSSIDEWYVKYKFDYTSLNEDRITKLLNNCFVITEDNDSACDAYASIVTPHQRKMIMKYGQHIHKLDANRQVIESYPSISLAAKLHNTYPKSIRNAICNMKLLQGFYWSK